MDTTEPDGRINWSGARILDLVQYANVCQMNAILTIARNTMTARSIVSKDELVSCSS